MGESMNTTDLEKSTDYDRLVTKFGLSYLRNIMKRIKNPHTWIRREIIFAHRDFDKILDLREKGKRFSVVSGRGPSNKIHLGHLGVFSVVKWIQDEYDAEVYIPLSDDEKYVFRKINGLRDALYYAYDNALDIAALGYKTKITHFFVSTKYPPLYEYSVRLSRYTTFSTIKAIFGFTHDTNPGAIFYPIVQSAHILLPTIEKGLPVVVPIAIDQDPYIRLTRDIAERLDYFKPAALHSKFLSGLDGKPMSASKPETAIFTDDDNKTIKRKIWKALTGGQGTLAKQRKFGGNPDKCVVYEWFRAYSLRSDDDLKIIYNECKSGDRFCGQCKKELTKDIITILKEHRKKKMELINKIDQFFLHDVDMDIINKIAEHLEKIVVNANE